MISQEELAELDGAVDRMLLTGSASNVEILGAGDIACVVGWRGLACKRLPPFDSARRVEAYRSVLKNYLERLGAAGVPFVPSEVQSCLRSDGKISGYVVQPRLKAETLLPTILKRAGKEEALEMFRQVLRHVHAFVNPQCGFDAQLSNWAVDGGRLILLDVTSTLLRDETGRDLFDSELFVAVLPAVVQGVVRRYYVTNLMDRFFTVRGVLLDLLGNSPNCGLGRLRELFLKEANAGLDRPLTMREIRAYHLQEKTTWIFLRRALMMEQFWQRKVKRAPHPVLLPSDYRPGR